MLTGVDSVQADANQVQESEVELSGLRQYKGIKSTVIDVLAAVLPIYVAIYLLGIPRYLGLYVYEQQHMGIVLGITLVLTFLLVPAHGKASREMLPWYDAIMAFASVLSTGYIVLFAGSIIAHRGAATPLEQVFGIILIVLILEAVRRQIGWPMAVLALFFLVYVIWGDIFPGPIHSKNYPLTRVIGNYYLGTMGIFTTPLQIATTVILAFVLFANFMARSGAGQFIIDVVFSAVGHLRGGAAKTAVVASSLFGTLSGSTVANATATGSFTIPLMKKTGYRPEFAAGVEAVSATGGLIMPPVMGPNAFLMAEFLSIPYIKVAAAAAIPAILYYVSLFFQTDFEAARKGIKGIPRENLPKLYDAVRTNMGWQFIVPVAVLVLFLLVWVYPPEIAALYSIAALFAVRFLHNSTRWDILRSIWPSLVSSGKGALNVICVTAAAGLIVGSITQTGLLYMLGPIMVQIAGGHLFLLLILAAVVSILLGMGMDALSVYILVTMLIVPSLIDAGLLPIVAHMFVLYFSIMSFITPPVCIVAYATAAIAGAKPFATGFIAMRLAIVAFVVPFIFVYDPVLMLQGGSVAGILEAVLTALVGVIYLAGGVSGYLFRSLNRFERIIMVAGGIVTMIPGWRFELVGAIILGAQTLLILRSLRQNQRNEALRAAENGG
ncbi:MAG: TRAP transporter fused permease subunit [Clostridia bacterium]|nr:MAG: TRAP transporter fused permease subunit [Clostridia bacterium]